MNYVVLGAGAIGSFYGAMLSKRHDVILIARKEHAKAMNKEGLHMVGKINKTFKVKASTSLKNIKENTAVLLTTKVTDSEEAIKRIRDKIRKDTIIICLQNGYGIEGIVKRLVKCRVLRALTNQGITFESPGRIRVNFRGYLKIEKDKKTGEIVKDMTLCGLKADISENIQLDVWKKMLINCVLNPLTAILNVPNNEVKKLDKTMQLIQEEIKIVLEKEKIFFSDKEYESARKLNFSPNISSMLQDIRKGNKTEIEYINGAIVKLGKKHGIPTPINQILVDIVHMKEGSGV